MLRWSVDVKKYDFHILKKSMTLHNKKSLQKRLYIQQKKYLHWQAFAAYLYQQLKQKLIEDATLKREISLRHFLNKLKQKDFFDENEYDKLYSSGSAPARIYGTPKMQKFSSSDSFPKLRSIVSSAGTFNYNLSHFLCDLQSSFTSGT